MKAYLNYSSSSHKNRWPFFKGKFKYPSLKAIEKNPSIDRGDIRIAYTALAHKKSFIDIVADRDQASKNWVKERASVTGNEWQIEQCDKHPDSIIVYVNEYHGGVPYQTIIEVIKIKDYKL